MDVGELSIDDCSVKDLQLISLRDKIANASADVGSVK